MLVYVQGFGVDSAPVVTHCVRPGRRAAAGTACLCCAAACWVSAGSCPSASEPTPGPGCAPHASPPGWSVHEKARGIKRSSPNTFQQWYFDIFEMYDGWKGWKAPSPSSTGEFVIEQIKPSNHTFVDNFHLWVTQQLFTQTHKQRFLREADRDYSLWPYRLLCWGYDVKLCVYVSVHVCFYLYQDQKEGGEVGFYFLFHFC